MDERRLHRVSEALKEELYELVAFELDDPRLLGVNVTDVMVSPDSKHANVKVSLGGDSQEQKHALAALEHAQGYLRSEVARRLGLRRVPELHFETDRAVGAAERVDFLLKRAKKKRTTPENPS